VVEALVVGVTVVAVGCVVGVVGVVGALGAETEVTATAALGVRHVVLALGKLLASPE
jgi:hypothetical protein